MKLVGEGGSNVDNWAKDIPGRQKSTSKGPEAGACPVYLRNGKKASATGVIKE